MPLILEEKYNWERPKRPSLACHLIPDRADYFDTILMQAHISVLKVSHSVLHCSVL